MVIGFEIRKQTVSESQAPPGMDVFSIMINIMSNITSEIDYLIPIRHVVNVGEATVVGTIPTTPVFDAVFGTVEPLVETQRLVAGNQELIIIIIIINDFRAEDLEYFSLRVVVTDAEMRTNFRCNEDGDGDDFFCLLTICIIDDDG